MPKPEINTPNLAPELRNDTFVFVTSATPPHIRVAARIVEDEGTTLVLTKRQADQLGLSYDQEFAWISLTANTALTAIGITARVAQTLANADIACNVLAGFHHDHILVPIGQAQDALALLQDA